MERSTASPDRFRVQTASAGERRWARSLALAEQGAEPDGV
ncbi:Hypothetical protein A7982_09848 [Minicystis rosea]|nr:Hypothetical protein A7982_09848 [Minicystis rosea]